VDDGTIRLHIERIRSGEGEALGEVREILAGNPERAHHVLRDGTTPLHVAATVEVADEFLAAGVTPGGLDEYGSTPLDSALSRAACGSVEAEALARRLIEAGASADAATYAALGDMDALERAIDADPIIRDATGRGGRAPLHAAVAHGHLKAALWLLGRGAHPSRPDANGISPLHWTSRAPRHDVEIATCLLAAGADPRARDGEQALTLLRDARTGGRSLSGEEVDRLIEIIGTIDTPKKN